jgi:hypothetical protein
MLGECIKNSTHSKLMLVLVSIQEEVREEGSLLELRGVFKEFLLVLLRNHESIAPLEESPSLGGKGLVGNVVGNASIDEGIGLEHLEI